MSGYARAAESDDDLLKRIRAAVFIGGEIDTLSLKRPNRIVGVDRKGIEVETLRSDSRGSRPQRVPA
jgi:hypothetical protein